MFERASTQNDPFKFPTNLFAYHRSAIAGSRSGSHLRAVSFAGRRCRLVYVRVQSPRTARNCVTVDFEIATSLGPSLGNFLTTTYKAERSDGERSRAEMRVLVPGARQEVAAMMLANDLSMTGLGSLDCTPAELRTRSRDARLRSWPGSSA